MDHIQGAVDQGHASGRSEDSRASALHAIASAGDVAAAGESLASGKPDVKVELSWGSSHSRNTFTEDGTTQQGSTVKAGGTAAFVATGNGSSGNSASGAGSGNLTIAGSDVSANDVILAAKNQVNLVNTTDTDTTHSTNESRSASVGISYGTQGWGVDGSMSKAHGNANSDAAMQNSTHVSGANSVSIVSGGDTNIIGAEVSGRQVSADIGGNLTIASVQDTTVSNAHQESTGGGFSISQGGGGASVSHTDAHANGSYAGVNEQAGIRAGDGGFDITVKGNTDLKGAVIASDATPDKNTLTTGTLTFSDIQNQSDYDAHSGGFSEGASAGAPVKGTGTSSVGNAGGYTPMLSQNDSGSDSALTRSGVSAGTVSITDGVHQTQDVASLNRDTSDTNGTVAKTPDVSRLLDRQADMMGAASAAGEAVTTQIGVIADAKYDAAKKAADQATKGGNPALAAQYQAEAARWDEGGTYRVLMHTAGGGLVAGLGGGSAVGGAVGAGVSALLAGELNAMADRLGNSDKTDPGLMAGNVAANILAGGIGGLIGGNSGAFAAANTDLYNRSNGNGDGKGGTGSELLDKARDAGNTVADWARNTFSDPVGDMKRWASQANGQMNADANAKRYEPPTDLMAQGAANGINAIIGAKGGEPPMANPGAVLVDTGAAQVARVDNLPGYATLNSGNGDQSLGGKSVSDLSDAAKLPDPSDKSGELSAAGRGLQKHGSRDDSAFPAAKGNPAAINEQGQKIVDEILNDSGRTVEQLNRGRYGDVIEVRASDGRGIRYGADGKFIGFLEPDK